MIFRRRVERLFRDGESRTGTGRVIINMWASQADGSVEISRCDGAALASKRRAISASVRRPAMKAEARHVKISLGRAKVGLRLAPLRSNKSAI